MILGHKEPPGEQPYWFGKVLNADRKFSRVVAGVILPVFDRQSGCIVVLGETFRSFAPMDLWGLGAAIGEYNAIENALRELDRDLKIGDAIMEHDDLRPLLWKIPGLSLKILTAAAPKYAFSEVGRQKVNRMIEENKLHLEAIEDRLEQSEPEVAAKAIQAAVCWMQEYPMLYRQKRKAQPEYQRVWGSLGL